MADQRYKHFVILIVVPAIVVSCLTILFGLFQQQLTGDLTRIGYFSENQFGWNQQHLKLVNETVELSKLDDYHDIMILGDSFSHVGSTYAKAFIQSTNIDTGILHTKNHDVWDVLDHYQKTDHFPKLFIYQTVERELKNRLNKFKDCPQAISNPKTAEALMINPKEIEMITHSRNIKPEPFKNFGYHLKYFYQRLLNLPAKAIRLKLKDNNEFSSTNQSHILIYSDDYNKNDWSENDWQTIKCNIYHLHNLLKENGSDFIFVLAPDKSTFYADIISDSNKPVSQINLLEDLKIKYLSAYAILSAQRQKNIKDIYLPNDTHWSFESNLIVYEKLLELANNYQKTN
jgi:hypothetical protein